MSNAKHPDKLRRYEDAMRRQAERDARDPQEQIDLLHTRPGRCRKEIDRLIRLNGIGQ